MYFYQTITDFLKGEDYHPVVFSEKLRLLDHTVCINEIDSELFKSGELICLFYN